MAVRQRSIPVGSLGTGLRAARWLPDDTASWRAQERFWRASPGALGAKVPMSRRNQSGPKERERRPRPLRLREILAPARWRRSRFSRRWSFQLSFDRHGHEVHQSPQGLHPNCAVGRAAGDRRSICARTHQEARGWTQRRAEGRRGQGEDRDRGATFCNCPKCSRRTLERQST